jgi:hypothetical protein
VSTLPLPRNNAGGGHQQQPLPLYRSTLQQRQPENEIADAQMLRAVSNGDIGKSPIM